MAAGARFSESCSLDVVGIGNAIVDVLVQTDDAFLQANGLQKGGMALIDEQQAETLYQSSGPGLETSGGSVANTMVGIAQLGGRAGFIGRVRDDQLGGIFSHDIRAVGARFETPAATSGATTARCLIYVTPDAERTMCTFLGASTQLEPDDLRQWVHGQDLRQVLGDPVARPKDVDDVHRDVPLVHGLSHPLAPEHGVPGAEAGIAREDPISHAA